jgi:hypothetical protein
MERTSRMDFVRPRLAIGTRTDAERAQFLATNGIQSVLSLAPADVPATMQWLPLGVAFTGGIPANLLARGCAFLAREIAAYRGVLVHGASGTGQAVAVVACHIALAERLPLVVALEETCRGHALTRPTGALLASVEDYVDEARTASTRMTNSRLGMHG